MADNKYINGIFIEQKEGQYGSYLSVGISEEGLKALQALAPSAKGFRNFTASPQRDNPNKFSAKPYVPKPSGATVFGDDSSSDLPF